MFTRITNTTTIDLDLSTLEKEVSVSVVTSDQLPQNVVRLAVIGACVSTLNELGYQLKTEDLDQFAVTGRRAFTRAGGHKSAEAKS